MTVGQVTTVNDVDAFVRHYAGEVNRLLAVPGVDANTAALCGAIAGVVSIVATLIQAIEARDA